MGRLLEEFRRWNWGGAPNSWKRVQGCRLQEEWLVAEPITQKLAVAEKTWGAGIIFVIINIITDAGDELPSAAASHHIELIQSQKKENYLMISVKWGIFVL